MIDVYYYSSSSGMVRLFAERLGRPVHDLSRREVRTSVPTGPWVLLTPSYKAGNADEVTLPAPVKAAMKASSKVMTGVAYWV